MERNLGGVTDMEDGRRFLRPLASWAIIAARGWEACHGLMPGRATRLHARKMALTNL